MPAIHLFGRKTLLGGDDLQIPCLLTITLRVVQLSVFILPLWFHIFQQAQEDGSMWDYIWIDGDDFDCRHSHVFPKLLFIYTLFSSIVTAVAFVVELRILHASSKGTPSEVQPRSKSVERLCEFKLLPLVSAQFLICILGIATVCFARAHYTCTSSSNTDDATLQQEDDFWSSVVTFDSDGPTKPTVLWWIAYSLLCITQGAEVFVIVLFWIRLYCAPASTSSDTVAVAVRPIPLHHDLMDEMWADRCTKFCECLGVSTCFLFGGRNMNMGDYGDVARALTDYFETGGYLDIVPSDIVMGFMVLQKVQRHRIVQARDEVTLQVSQSNSSEGTSTNSAAKYNSRRSFFLMHQEGSQTFYESTSRRVLNMNNNFDRFTLQEGTRFARYQLAIYTWLIYLYQNPVTGLPRLLAKSGCAGCACCTEEEHLEDNHGQQVPNELVVGDNWCKLHKAALLLQAGITEDTTELVYAQLYSSFTEIPYTIIIDHAWKSVVLAIRGTFSLEDCVTDVLIDPASLEQLGEEFGFDGTGEHCHGGVMGCARVVYRDLERHKILDKLLLGDDAPCCGYTLRVVGHSLGAATATLVSFMLRQRFSTLRCLSYSPPGGTMTMKIAQSCQDWCTAFVLDSDMVPRLSLQTLEFLRDEVLELIGRVKVPKVEVARMTMPSAQNLCRSNRSNHDVDALAELVSNMLYAPEDVPQDSDYKRQLESFRAIQEERRSSRGVTRTINMYPPGRLVHFLKTGERPSWTNSAAKCVTLCTSNYGSVYTPIWVNNDDFNEIVISPTCWTDHFPNRLAVTMEDMAEEYGLDTTQSSTYEGPVDLSAGMS